ncbi:MAG: hypothetical protein U0353_13675 [Sandaracinus sp.]
MLQFDAEVSRGCRLRRRLLVDVNDEDGEEARKRLNARLRKLRDAELRALGRVLDALELMG